MHQENQILKCKKPLKKKNRKADKPISEDDINKTNNLQDIEKIIDWIGNNKNCTKTYWFVF